MPSRPILKAVRSDAYSWFKRIALYPLYPFRVGRGCPRRHDRRRWRLSNDAPFDPGIRHDPVTAVDTDLLVAASTKTMGTIAHGVSMTIRSIVGSDIAHAGPLTVFCGYGPLVHRLVRWDASFSAPARFAARHHHRDLPGTAPERALRMVLSSVLCGVGVKLVW